MQAAERSATDHLPPQAGKVAAISLKQVLGPPLGVYFAIRLLLVLIARSAAGLLPSHGPNPSVLPHNDMLAGAWAWTAPWFRFDTAWYVQVAEHGYHWGRLGTASTNFMPLYPVLIRVVQPIALGSPWLAAWIVANAGALGAAVLLLLWARSRFGHEIGMRVLLLVTVFPFAFFLVTPYAEPLFLALALAAFLFAERDRWALATCAAGLCTVTRPVGLAVVVALVVMASAGRRRREAVLSCLAVIPLLLFMAYLGIAFGHPFAFLSYHSAGWVPPHGGLPRTIGSQFQTHLSPWDRVDAFMTALFLVSVPFVWRRIGPGYAVYVLVGVSLPLVHGLVSMERYVVVLFPTMAWWALWKSRVGQAIVFSLSLLVMLIATTLYAQGYSIY